jgi:hypothetical protein
METIDDIREEEGNPRAGDVGGKPRSIFNVFNQGSGARLVAVLLVILGAIFLIAGALLFQAPLVVVGLAIVLIAALAYFWSRPHHFA